VFKKGILDPAKTVGSNTFELPESMEFGYVGRANPSWSMVTKFGIMNPLYEDT
jgi:hypothetical protein